MKTLDIIGYKRASIGKKCTKDARKEGKVPCVLYGLKITPIHFLVPMILFRKLVYTNEAHFVDLDIEGEKYRTILQDIQFHPVNETILHADFLQIKEDIKIKMSIPIRLEGQSIGVTKGGILIHKKPSLKVRGYPKDMPEHITLDVSSLDFHHAIKVADVPKGKLEYLDSMKNPIVVVESPRAAKIAKEENVEQASEEAKDKSTEKVEEAKK